MIKLGHGNITIKGPLTDILADISFLVNRLYFNVMQENMEIPAQEARKCIIHAVETGMRPIEDIRKENKKDIELSDNIPNLFSGLSDRKG
ncbi:MAG: hypothetical protein IJ466_07205 [Clostridia bacterium]|nr:hypothetical protein [Clostridia bacterium]